MIWKIISNIWKTKEEKEISEADTLIEEEDTESVDPTYAMTVFLFLFKKQPRKREEHFPAYTTYELNIINTAQYFDELVEKQLIEPSSEEDILGLLKVTELKDILQKNGLKKTGNKPELIKRILNSTDHSQIGILSEPYYSLSSNGNDFLSSHNDFIKVRQNPQWGIGIQEYIRMKEISNTPDDFETIILSLLNQKLSEIKKKRFDLSQYEYSRLHEIYISASLLLQEKDDCQGAMKTLLSSVLLSVSGCENYWLIGYKRDLNLKNAEVLRNYRPIHIDEFVAVNILSMQTYYNEQLATDAYRNFIGPFNLCTFEMFSEIIKEIFTASTLDLKKYDQVIKADFIKKLK